MTITPICVKAVCHNSVPTNANNAIAFLFKSGVSFWAMPIIAWATTATATIFNP